jgi:hypothetical protein
MADYFLPPVTHVIPLTSIRRERVLPVPGTVTVRVNEKVNAAHVVAEAEPVSKHYFLDLARGLGVHENQVSKYLTRHEGDRLDEGEVLAGPVGFTRRTVRAPADGRIIAISRGRLLFEARGNLLELRAGFPGVVVATDGVSTVSIQTTGTLIQGVWGNGGQDFGVMRIIGENPGDRFKADQIDVNLRGAVLVAGICDDPEPLHQATELAVRGVIVGGLSSSLIPVVQRLPYSVVVLEGFGVRPINPIIYDLLNSNEGREVAIEAEPARPYERRRPEIIIPLSVSRDVSLPDEVIQLTAGLRVRVLRSPYEGEVGSVMRVLDRPSVYPSGVSAFSASVVLEGIGTVAVPVANLEILQ